MHKKSVLDNGIRIVTNEVADRDSIALGFWVGVGGRYEEDRTKGIAHFLEHIVFKGSRKFSCEEIKRRIEGVGGALNAFTSEEQTCFYAKIPSKHLPQTFDVLSDMVIYPRILTKDVGKEKGVIIEEIKMYHDLPQYLVLEKLDELMWPDHPLGKNLAGSVETVASISSGDLKKFHQINYSPDRIVVAACGKVKHERIVRMVRDKFKSLIKKRRNPCIPVNGLQDRPRIKCIPKTIEQMHVALGIPGYAHDHPDRYGLSILSIILGGNMSSRLFVEVREKKGLAYSISCSYKTLQDTGLFLIRAGVDNLKIVDALEVILRELNKIKRDGVPMSEFRRAREYLSGQLVLGLEDTLEHMLWIGEGMITRNRIKTLNSILKELEKIKPADIKRIAKDVLNTKRYNLALVGPVKGPQEGKIKSLLGF